MQECSFDGCTRAPLHNSGEKSGLCNSHTKQLERGKELTPLRLRMSPACSAEEKLLARINKTATCWLWTGAISGNGYGSMRHQSVSHRPHRLAYETWVAEIPANSVVHHTCGVRACVNPAHLQAVTQSENVAEMLERKSYKKQIKQLEQQVKKLERELKKANRG